MLFKREYGNRSKPSLIFVHGFLGTGEDFSPVIHSLADDFFCVTIDLPGHGGSKDLFPNSAEDAKILFLKTLTPYLSKQTALVGYSMGGRLIQSISSLISNSTLILISSALFPPTCTKTRKAFDAKTTTQLLKESFPSFLENWYNAPLFSTLKSNSDSYRKMIERRKKENPNALSQALKALSPTSLITKLPLNQSFCYVVGEQDTKYYSQTAKIKQNYPNATLSICPGASHAIHIENPEFVADEIQNYFRCNYDRMD